MSGAKKLETSNLNLEALLDPQLANRIVIVEVRKVTDKAGNSDSVIGVCDNFNPSGVLTLALDGTFAHICQRSNPGLQQNLNASAIMLQNKENFLSFPTATILAPTQAGLEKEKELLIYERTFSRSKEKSEILEEVRAAIELLGKSGSFVDDASSIVDELYTNALFNAPFVDRMANGAPRKSPNVELDKGLTARMFLGTDGERLVLGCEDPFGTLRVNGLLARVRDCYTEGVAENMNMGPGGAGIGSFMVFETSASYFAAVQQGVKTVVCSTLPLKLSRRQRAALPKNLHYFEI